MPMYKRPLAPTVTLVCVTGVHYFKALSSLLISYARFNSKEVLFINSRFGNFKIGRFRFEKPIDSKLDSIESYGKYVQFHLWQHISTEYVLIVQADGWILNGNMWSDEFLLYDYIGAPWPIRNNAYVDPFGNHQRVGNGGFSLRSKKLLELGLQLPITWDVTKSDFYKHYNVRPLAEDGNICVHHRHLYQSAGCAFAPLDVAIKFSRELSIPEAENPRTFGFHQYHPSKGKLSKGGVFALKNLQRLKVRAKHYFK